MELRYNSHVKVTTKVHLQTKAGPMSLTLHCGPTEVTNAMIIDEVYCQIREVRILACPDELFFYSRDTKRSDGLLYARMSMNLNRVPMVLQAKIKNNTYDSKSMLEAVIDFILNMEDVTDVEEG